MFIRVNLWLKVISATDLHRFKAISGKFVKSVSTIIIKITHFLDSASVTTKFGVDTGNPQILDPAVGARADDDLVRGLHVSRRRSGGIRHSPFS